MSKRQAIIDAAAELFAKNSYNSVGIRDITSRAGANSAMISYYFGGKAGLLREIFASFSELVYAELAASFKESSDHYEMCEISVRRMVYCARSNKNLFILGLKELNHGAPELEELRTRHHELCNGLFESNIDKLGLSSFPDYETQHITFTAVMGAIYSNLLLEDASALDDHRFVEKYIAIITTILKDGVTKVWD